MRKILSQESIDEENRILLTTGYQLGLNTLIEWDKTRELLACDPPAFKKSRIQVTRQPLLPLLHCLI